MLDVLTTPEKIVAVLAVAVFLVLFAIWVRRSFEKERDWLLALGQLKANPSRIAEVHLVDNDPISVEVRDVEGRWLKPNGPYGVSAVRLYDELRQLAPQAIAYVTRNGRRVAYQGDVPNLSVRLT